MSSWNANALLAASPAEVLERLTDPEAIARWAPVPFDVLALDGARLQAGSRARVAGRLAGRSVEFDVDVVRASGERLELVALGPIDMNVLYRLRPAGSACELEASVSVQGRGVFGRVLAKATEALLAGGALRVALGQLACELQPALAA
jgi:hypothetical protein